MLNSYTRWGHTEILEMDVEELTEWLGAVRDVYPEK